jgi:chromosome segregation ATPase
MPELYGHPRKDELRKEIRELHHQLGSEMREHSETQRSLNFAQARIALLTKKTEFLEERLKDLLAEASKEISYGEVHEEARRIRMAKTAEITAAAEAEAASPNH